MCALCDCVCLWVCVWYIYMYIYKDVCIYYKLMYISATTTCELILPVVIQATIDPHTQTDINMFRIEYYIDGEDPTEPVIMINDPDIRSITISELKDNTTYGVRIQAINSGGPSEYSTPVTQTTLCELLKVKFR